MRILVLSDHAWPIGGAEEVALRSAEGLARRGHEVHFIGGVRRGFDDEGPVGCTLHAIAESPIVEAGGKAWVRGIWNRRTADLLEQTLRQGSLPETVVHIHHWSTLLTSSVIRRSLNIGVPTVLSLHDYAITCPNGGFFDYPTDTICGRKPLGFACTLRNCDKNSYLQKVWRLARAHVQRTLGRAHDPRIHFVSVTEFAREIQARFLPSDCGIEILENPLMVRDFIAADRPVDRYVLFAGRLSQEKGPDLLAQAAQDAGIPCVFAGEGPLLEELKSRFASHEFTGRLGRSDLLGLMADAAVVVVPSRWYETQSLVAWEAAAMGVPVVAAGGTAPGQFVSDVGCGRVFRRGDSTSLRAELGALWRDPGLAMELGRIGRRFVQQRDRGLEAHVQALEDFYSSVLDVRTS